MANVTCDDFSFEMLPKGDMDTAGVYMAVLDSINVSTGLADITYDISTAAHPEIIDEDVPFFYHCQRGSYAFGRPDWGFSAFSEDEEVIVIHFPSTATASATTHIIGHYDISGITQCDKNEYLYVERGAWFYMFDVFAGSAIDLDTFENKTGSPAKPSSWPAGTGTYATWVAYNFDTLTSAVSVPITVGADAVTNWDSASTTSGGGVTNTRWDCTSTVRLGDYDGWSLIKADLDSFSETIPITGYREPFIIQSQQNWDGVERLDASWTYYQRWDYDFGSLKDLPSWYFNAISNRYTPMDDSPTLYDSVNDETYIWRISFEIENVGLSQALQTCAAVGTISGYYTWDAKAEVIIFDLFDSTIELGRASAVFNLSATSDGSTITYSGTGLQLKEVETELTGWVREAGDYNYFFLAGLYASVGGFYPPDEPAYVTNYPGFEPVPYATATGSATLTTTEVLTFAGVITRLADIEGYDFEAKETTLKDVVENKDATLSESLGEETTDILGVNLAATSPLVGADITAYKRLYDT